MLISCKPNTLESWNLVQCPTPWKLSKTKLEQTDYVGNPLPPEVAVASSLPPATHPVYQTTFAQGLHRGGLLALHDLVIPGIPSVTFSANMPHTLHVCLPEVVSLKQPIYHSDNPLISHGTQS